jgi:hypothetical protein
METEISLSQTTAGRIAITVGGELLTTTKDGGPLVQRVDRILSQHRIRRGGGYTLRDGALVATGADLR